MVCPICTGIGTNAIMVSGASVVSAVSIYIKKLKTNEKKKKPCKSKTQRFKEK